MTNIEVKVEGKEPKARKGFWWGLLEFILAWLVVLAIGTFVPMGVLFMIWLISPEALGSEEYQNGAMMTLFGLIGGLIVARLLAKRRKLRGVFSSNLNVGLAIGVVCFALVLVGGMISLLSKGVLYSSDTSQRCVDLQDNFFKIQSATIPIATDLGTGTGFAVDANGTMLTAYHVIDGAKKVYANYTTGNVDITVLDTAPGVDLALLRINQPTPDFLRLTDRFSAGEALYVYGYPQNLFSAGVGSLSSGIVSRIITNQDLKLNFPDLDFPGSLEFIQTDAAMNPGNSGGPVVSRCGVIGIAAAVSDTSGLYSEFNLRSEQNISFSVSARTASEVFSLPFAKAY